MAFEHYSVLLNETVENLNIDPGGVYVDGTLGGAGHSSVIASKLTTGRLIGIDRDETALAAAAERLKPWADRVTLVHGNFGDIKRLLEGIGRYKKRNAGESPPGEAAPGKAELPGDTHCREPGT